MGLPLIIAFPRQGVARSCATAGSKAFPTCPLAKVTLPNDTRILLVSVNKNSTVRGIIPDKEAVMTLWALQPCKRSPSFILTGRLTEGVTDRLYQKGKSTTW